MQATPAQAPTRPTATDTAGYPSHASGHDAGPTVAEAGTVIQLGNQNADYYDGDEWRTVSTRDLAL